MQPYVEIHWCLECNHLTDDEFAAVRADSDMPMESYTENSRNEKEWCVLHLGKISGYEFIDGEKGIYLDKMPGYDAFDSRVLAILGKEEAEAELEQLGFGHYKNKIRPILHTHEC